MFRNNFIVFAVFGIFVSIGVQAQARPISVLFMYAKPEETPLFGARSEAILLNSLKEAFDQISLNNIRFNVLDQSLLMSEYIVFGSTRTKDVVKGVAKEFPEVDVLILYDIKQNIELDNIFELARMTYQLNLEVLHLRSETSLSSSSHLLSSPPDKDLSETCALNTDYGEFCRGEDLKLKLFTAQQDLAIAMGKGLELF